MSLALLQSVEVYIKSMIDGLKKNDDEMSQNKSDIANIYDLFKKGELEYKNDQGALHAEITNLQAADVIQNGLDLVAAEDIDTLQTNEALWEIRDAESRQAIDTLRAEILALKATNTVQDEGEKKIKVDVDVLKTDVKELKSKEEMEKIEEIATLELMIAGLKEQLVVLNDVELSTLDAVQSA